MIKERNWNFIRGLDLGMVLAVVLLLGASLLILSTASINVMASDPYHYVKTQVVWIATGIVLAVIVAFTDYENYKKIGIWIYAFNIFLLLLVFAFGSEAKGAQRWIPITSTQSIQPSEFAKILLIVTFASFLNEREGKLNNVKDFISPLLFVLPPTLLIFLQPDLGTAMVFGAIFIGMMFVAGANPIKFGAVIVGCIGTAIGAVALHLATNLPGPLKFLEGLPLPLKDYQINRFIAFLDPAKDTSGDGYHVIQSVWAIGSGGIWGKGYQQGTQAQYNFLPEHHTDFIFSVVGEEFGFIGTSILLFIFCILLLRMITVATKSRDRYGVLIVSGVVSMIVFHVFINVGMASGIMPVTGIPLPFITSGGSSMWANMLAVGLVLSVSLRGERRMF
ncbi:MAG: rod shape-determining protein RodA [Dehalobacter sp. 4CP]|uniref:rod shape-determining protein RodA n=1 Tax=Dehalobacter sp. CP TaxID=2594474 RepID=UPI0013C70495|nr:rod shape-determining protein RodA [Dehalobacter sp. 4CP]